MSSIALAGTALIVRTDIIKRLRIKIADLLISILTGGGGGGYINDRISRKFS